MRTWGFYDRNRTSTSNGLPQYGGSDSDANVMQKWQNGKAEINLKPFDKVVAAAQKTDMKLLVTLTNNWADYGGMDVYTVQLGGKYHDDVSSISTCICKEYITDESSSFTAIPRSKPHTRTTSVKSSSATLTPPASLLGNSPMSHVAAQMVCATFRAAALAHPTPSQHGSTK